ncbi:MAG: hypothetical protein PQJ58_08420 [Spirochaetales bacterium]|nr:hypothetical protein [Spirochaetales bacterium]
MKLSRSILLFLLAMASSPLFSHDSNGLDTNGLNNHVLDIYVNNILWHSYSSEDLDSLQVGFHNSELTEPDFTAIPFPELLPLMSEIEGIRLFFHSGEVFLSSVSDSIRTSALKEGPEGKWDLSLDGSVYHNPGRIELYGTALPEKELLLWSEPGLTGLDRQIDIWSSLHKIRVTVKEVSDIDTKLIFRKMTGDLMPDFVLRFQDPAEPYEEGNTVAFLLQSVLTPVKEQETDTLVLPSGHKLHPDLFMSILASLSDRVSPHDPGWLTDPDSIKKASAIYLEQLLNRRIVEQDDFFTDENYRNTNYAFFPSGSYLSLIAHPADLPLLRGLERPLSPRVLPVQLQIKREDLPAGTLIDFLKLPGIQHQLLSAENRQLPEHTEALKHRDLNDEEQQLYEDWKRGYILSDSNYAFRREIEQNLPDLLRGEGELPR